MLFFMFLSATSVSVAVFIDSVTFLSVLCEIALTVPGWSTLMMRINQWSLFLLNGPPSLAWHELQTRAYGIDGEIDTRFCTTLSVFASSTFLSVFYSWSLLLSLSSKSLHPLLRILSFFVLNRWAAHYIEMLTCQKYLILKFDMGLLSSVIRSTV